MDKAAAIDTVSMSLQIRYSVFLILRLSILKLEGVLIIILVLSSQGLRTTDWDSELLLYS